MLRIFCAQVNESEMRHPFFGKENPLYEGRFSWYYEGILKGYAMEMIETQSRRELIDAIL